MFKIISGHSKVILNESHKFLMNLVTQSRLHELEFYCCLDL